MNQLINVDTAAFAIAGEGQVLATQGIGSCIVVCIYDRVQKRGALIHSMLPYAEKGTVHPLRFVDTAIPRALSELNAARPGNMEAHLIGGASMFSNLEDHIKLGEQNVAAAEKILAKHDIIIRSKNVGGSIGRSVIFYIDSGEIKIITK